MMAVITSQFWVCKSCFFCAASDQIDLVQLLLVSGCVSCTVKGNWI